MAGSIAPSKKKLSEILWKKYGFMYLMPRDELRKFVAEREAKKEAEAAAEAWPPHED